ncbi:MAG: hypothetical protein AAF761_06265, partial [Pseudomonadota bacterium]
MTRHGSNRPRRRSRAFRRFTAFLSGGVASLALFPALAEPAGPGATLSGGAVEVARTGPYADGFDPAPTPLEAKIYDPPGSFTAHVLDPWVYRFYGGQQQANPSSALGTGNQLYFLGAEVGLAENLQIGVNYFRWEDPLRIPAETTSTNFFSVGGHLTYRFYDSGPLSVSARAGAEYFAAR